MYIVHTSTTMKPTIQLSVLKVLSYFMVFQYPLVRKEIKNFLSQPCNDAQLDEALNTLLADGCIYCIDGYYCLQNDPLLVVNRKLGNSLCSKKMKRAKIIGRFLGLFPFVRAVYISGSLSKDFAKPSSDLDFFIVTAPNRLWTARNFMHLFRKFTFITGSQGNFCMNYYLSLQQPEISPKSYFTAMEFATLKPAYILDNVQDCLLQNNKWIHDFFPNATPAMATAKKRKNFFFGFIEFMLDMLGGDRLEQLFYRTTLARWERKWQRAEYDVAECMKSVGRHVNTPANYPVNFPVKILERFEKIYNQSLHEYEEKLLAAQ